MSKFLGYREWPISPTITPSALLAAIKAQLLAVGWQVIREEASDARLKAALPEVIVGPTGPGTEVTEVRPEVSTLYLLPPVGQPVGNEQRRNVACLGLLHHAGHVLSFMSAGCIQHLQAQGPVYQLTPLAAQPTGPLSLPASTLSLSGRTYAADMTDIPTPQELYPFPIVEEEIIDEGGGNFTVSPPTGVPEFTDPTYAQTYGMARALEEQGAALAGWRWSVQGKHLILHAPAASPAVLSTDFEVLPTLPAVAAGEMTVNLATVQHSMVPLEAESGASQVSMHLTAYERSVQLALTGRVPIFDGPDSTEPIDTPPFSAGYLGLHFSDHQQAAALTPPGCTPVELWLSASPFGEGTNFVSPKGGISLHNKPGFSYGPPLMNWPLVGAHFHAVGHGLSREQLHGSPTIPIQEIRGPQQGWAFPAAPGQFVDATVTSTVAERPLYSSALLCGGFPAYLTRVDEIHAS